jgi:hypothetical protein
MFRTAAGLVAVSTALALSGCGAKQAADGAPIGDGHPTGTAASSAAASGQPVTINKTAWYDGLKLAFESVSYDPSGKITVSVSVANNTTHAINLGNISSAFTADGHSNRGGFAPDTMLEGGGTGKETMKFDAEEPVKDPASGVITVGAGDQAQAIVPVGSAGTLVDLQPKAVLAAPKTVPLAGLSYTVSTCELRADFPAGPQQAHKGKRLVTCAITVQNTYRTYIYIGSAQFGLKPPDGPAFTATYESFTREEVAQGGKDEVTVAWEIPWPAGGTYALALSWLGQQGTDKPTAQNTGSVPLAMQLASIAGSPSRPSGRHRGPAAHGHPWRASSRGGSPSRRSPVSG